MESNNNSLSSSKSVRFSTVLSSSENEKQNSSTSSTSSSFTPIERKNKNEQRITKVKNLVQGIEQKELDRKTIITEFQTQKESAKETERKIVDWMIEKKKHTLKYDTGNGIYLYSLRDCSTASRIGVKEIWKIVLKLTDKDTLKKIQMEVKRLMNEKYGNENEIVFMEKKPSAKKPKINDDEGIVEIN